MVQSILRSHRGETGSAPSYSHFTIASFGAIKQNAFPRTLGAAMNDTTATISSAAGLQEQARPPDWRETEYKELNNTGRALYDAYFKLAPMTFA